MEKIAEMAMDWLCRKADDWLSGKIGNDKATPELELFLRYEDDECGRCFCITMPLATGNRDQAWVRLHSPRGVSVKAISNFADDNGDFLQARLFIGDECQMYVPFSALSYPKAGEYTVSVAVVRDGNSLGTYEWKVPLPAPRPWNKVDYAAPLIDLGMMVVRAEGSAVAEKVRKLKELFIREFELSTTEIIDFHDAMKRSRGGDVQALAKRAWFRFFVVTANDLLGLLAKIAKSDGALTTAELSIIRESAIAFGVAENDWPSIAEEFGLAVDDPWETLGVSHDASLNDIKAAYRRKITECHPDRFGQVPREFQELATKATVNLQSAYERLKSRCEAS